MLYILTPPPHPQPPPTGVYIAISSHILYCFPEVSVYITYIYKQTAVLTFHVMIGVGGYSYLYEPLWWVGMITSKRSPLLFLLFHSKFLIDSLLMYCLFWWILLQWFLEKLQILQLMHLLRLFWSLLLVLLALLSGKSSESRTVCIASL